jgi:hypothetical protein
MPPGLIRSRRGGRDDLDTTAVIINAYVSHDPPSAADRVAGGPLMDSAVAIIARSAGQSSTPLPPFDYGLVRPKFRCSRGFGVCSQIE